MIPCNIEFDPANGTFHKCFAHLNRLGRTVLGNQTDSAEAGTKKEL
jgi:hypothetical protein